VTRKKPGLVEGLARGLETADVGGMADTLGQGLVRVSEAWLPKRKLAVPQTCVLPGCGAGPYSSTDALKHHLCMAHAGMSDRERSFALDQARRTAVRQAMNGVPRSP
jgi:hypothetical protein